MLMELLLGIVGGSSMMDQRRNNGSDSASLDNEDEEDSSSDSSIGAPNDSEEEEEEEEEGFNNGCTGSSCSISEEATTMKKGGFGSLGSLASLEDSLPIKKGLSIHMSGKSKSFTNLSEAASSLGSVKDLEKTEHPFNKKRRVLRWSRRNYYKLGGQNSPKSMPVLPLIKDDEDEGQQQNNSKHHPPPPPHQNQSSSSSSSSSERGSRGTREAAGGGFSGYNKPLFTKQRPIFKSSSYSCFSLADLAEHDDDEEEDDNDDD